MPGFGGGGRIHLFFKRVQEATVNTFVLFLFDGALKESIKGKFEENRESENEGEVMAKDSKHGNPSKR